jgi:integrase
VTRRGARSLRQVAANCPQRLHAHRGCLRIGPPGPRAASRSGDQRRLADAVRPVLLPRAADERGPDLHHCPQTGVRGPGVLRLAHRRGVCRSGPWVGLRVSMRRRRTLPRSLAGYEVSLLLRYVAGSAHVATSAVPEVHPKKASEATTLLAVAVMVSTGVRVGELVALRCDDVDVAGRRMRINGKGSREREVYLANAWVADLVTSYLETRRQLGLDHHHVLFNHSDRPLTTGALRGRIQRAAAGAGLPRRVTPHMLRHTAAT